jgi:hypothetical protein
MKWDIVVGALILIAILVVFGLPILVTLGR